MKAIIKQESNFNPGALSAAGAIGLMQVMPFNAERLGMAAEELWIPARNALAGTRLLAVLLGHYRGDLISTLVAYNARPRKLLAPLPNNGETPAYVAAVLRNFRRYSTQGSAAPNQSRPPIRSRLLVRAMWRRGDGRAARAAAG